MAGPAVSSAAVSETASSAWGDPVSSRVGVRLEQTRIMSQAVAKAAMTINRSVMAKKAFPKKAKSSAADFLDGERGAVTFKKMVTS
jgi:hypothetical protein